MLKDMKCYVGMITRGRPGDKCISSLSFQEAIVNSVKEEPFDGGKYVTLDTSLGEFNQLIRDGGDYAMIPFYGNCPYTAKNIQMCTLADDKDKAIAILNDAFKTLLTDIQMALYPVTETKDTLKCEFCGFESESMQELLEHCLTCSHLDDYECLDTLTVTVLPNGEMLCHRDKNLVKKEDVRLVKRFYRPMGEQIWQIAFKDTELDKKSAVNTLMNIIRIDLFFEKRLNIH